MGATVLSRPWREYILLKQQVRCWRCFERATFTFHSLLDGGR